MSQDLLAEFGDFTLKDNSQNNAWTQPSIPQSMNGQQAQPNQAQIQTLPQETDYPPWGEDDDFGAFEEPEQDPITQSIVSSKPAVKEVPKQTKPFVPPSKPFAPPATTKKATSAKQLSSSHPFANNADVLFDADDYDEYADADVVGSWGDDDDFGDFETSETPTTKAGHGTNKPVISSAIQQKTTSRHPIRPDTLDLLGLDEAPPLSKPTQPLAAKPKQSTVARPPKTTKPISKTGTRHTAVEPQQTSTPLNDDAWDDFETPQPQAPSPSHEETTPINLPTALLGDLTIPPTTTGVAPSNIPPPSVLLTLFPPVLTSLSQQFIQPLSTLSPSQKSHFLSSTETRSFLASYLTLTHVLGHVIAGRKSRWKRDKHLAQSMRIGPSTSGRSGGMKLTGLDRSEAGREDTEVEDAMRAWRDQVGRFKSAVVGAGEAATGKLAVPELAVVMPVRVAKDAEGAIASTQACALCGLKREERVAKVDLNVEDSFGEWWIEGTNMHTACAKFWEVFKGRLSAR